MKFPDMKYQRPDLSKLQKELSLINEGILNAKTVEETAELYKKAEEINMQYSSMGSLCYIRHTINTKDEFYEAENNFFDENGPIVQDLMNKINRSLLDSKFRPELEAEFGELLFLNTEISVRSFSSEIIELSAEENRLQSEYQKLYASAVVEWEGETIPLTKLGIH
ncbi:MAG: M3 family oligoendopeptidase, partial [Clostridia bacterium]|nr:M3 family oligoendopeptidase [Clostridia bacterium]